MSKNLEQAKRLFAAGETMQVERFAEHFSDESLYKFANNSAAHSPQEIINGSEEFLKRVTSVKHNIVNHHESGGRLYLQMEISYTCANGAQHTLPCCDALEFDEEWCAILSATRDLGATVPGHARSTATLDEFARRAETKAHVSS